MAPNKKRVTRKRQNGKVLNVRSHGAVKAFEHILSKGPLTLVYINAKWCGACHRFNDEVWSHLTKLKNKSVNLASVDSEMIGRTTLANVPRKFYPTLMLVGKDKKPATFEDEEGNPTNAMPRNNTLSEDREALSNLIINPTVKSSVAPSIGPSMGPSMGPSITSSMGPSMSPSINTIARSNSPRRAKVTRKSLAKSPFESLNNMEENSNIPRTVTTMEINPVSTSPSRKILKSNPPEIGLDIVASTGELMPTSIKGGSMLDAIRRQTAGLKSMLGLRNSSKRKYN